MPKVPAECLLVLLLMGMVVPVECLQMLLVAPVVHLLVLLLMEMVALEASAAVRLPEVVLPPLSMPLQLKLPRRQS